MVVHSKRNDRVTLHYTARTRTSGLTDIICDVLNGRTGVSIRSGTMTELGNRGIYFYTFKAPPYDKTYFAIMDSVTKPFHKVEEVVVAGERGGGGIIVKGTNSFMNKVIWTTKEKKELFELLKKLFKELDSVKKGLSKVDAVQQKIHVMHDDISKTYKIITSTKHIDKLSKNISEVLQEIKTNDKQLLKKIDNLKSKLVFVTQSLSEDIQKYDKMSLLVSELNHISVEIEDFKKAYASTLSVKETEAILSDTDT